MKKWHVEADVLVQISFEVEAETEDEAYAAADIKDVKDIVIGKLNDLEYDTEIQRLFDKNEDGDDD